MWVRFEHPGVRIQLRARYKHLYKPGINPNWTPIMPFSREFAAGHKGQVQVQRFQYTLRQAKAKSIYRTQGSTTDKVVDDLSQLEKQREPIHHVQYVALSRVKTIDGLYITNLNTKLEDLKVLRRSPDLLNNVKIGQGQLQLIMEQILFLPYTFWSSDLNNLMNNPSNTPVISEKKMFR